MNALYKNSFLIIAQIQIDRDDSREIRVEWYTQINVNRFWLIAGYNEKCNWFT